MEFQAVEILGLIAGLFGAGSFLPQAFKIIRTKQTRDISLSMYVLFSFALFLWLIYGLLIGSLSIVMWNSVTLLLTLVIVYLKIRHG